MKEKLNEEINANFNPEINNIINEEFNPPLTSGC